MSRRSVPLNVKGRAVQLLQDGLSAREVGRRLGVAHKSVRRWGKDVPVRARPAQKEPPPQVVERPRPQPAESHLTWIHEQAAREAETAQRIRVPQPSWQ